MIKYHKYLLIINSEHPPELALILMNYLEVQL